MDTNPLPSQERSDQPVGLATLQRFVRWLVEPAGAMPEPERRQARLLVGVLLALIVLVLLAFVAVFAINPYEDPLRAPVLPAAVAIVVTLAIAYGMSRAGRYRAAAHLAVAITALGAWAVVMASRVVPDVLSLALTLTAVSVMLSSLLLSVRTTAVLALANAVAAVLSPLFIPEMTLDGMISALTVTGIMSGLVIASAFIRQRDLDQIDQQTRELSESESRFRQLFERSPDAIILIDPHDPRVNWPIVDCNEVACHMNGYRREELIGQSVDILNVLPGNPDERRDYAERLRRHSILHLETIHRHKDGSIFPIEVSTSFIMLGGRELILGIDRNIAERKRAEEAIRKSEAELQAILDNSAAIVYLKDTEGRYLLVNRQHETVFNIGREHTLGKTSDEIFPPEVAERYWLLDQKVLREGSPLQVEETAIRSDGQHTYLSVKFPLRDSEGVPYAVCSMSTDITNRKRIEEELQVANEKLTRWLAELEARTREIGLLHEMGEQLQTCLNVEEAYTVVSYLAKQLFPNEAGSLYVISASRNVVESVAVWGTVAEKAARRVFAPDDCRALRRGRMQLMDGGQGAPLCVHLHGAPPGVYVCIPLVAQGEAVGVLNLSCMTPESISEAKQRLARTVADAIALALANLKLRETLRLQSIRDPLTGLFNRRYLEETLEREVRRAGRSQRPLGIVMLDIDHFKHFNDTFGHAGGDTLLRELGELLRSRIRVEDIPCRYGGEEFVLILPESPLDVTQRRAELLRTDVKQLHPSHAGQSLGRVTVSIGVATFPDHGLTGEVVLRAADEALYRAKHEGRDRVVVSTV